MPLKNHVTFLLVVRLPTAARTQNALYAAQAYPFQKHSVKLQSQMVHHRAGTVLHPRSCLQSHGRRCSPQ